MPRYMFQGMGLSSRVLLGLAKKAKYGSLMPTERKVPTAASSMPRASQVRWASAAPVMVMVLETKPLKSGMPEMETAPTM